ncbi:hypothetical protein DNTS_001777 [Danionella cerebrum]|uniref:Uncharacterized protein n=1 Tax=Danionella cerebrum TaxID=2873325 RepID=A0A553MNR0_9TELE|nr:hypothetical protein DNTS_001777 [Danionella translucida]
MLISLKCTVNGFFSSKNDFFFFSHVQFDFLGENTAFGFHLNIGVCRCAFAIRGSDFHLHPCAKNRALYFVLRPGARQTPPVAQFNGHWASVAHVDEHRRAVLYN